MADSLFYIVSIAEGSLRALPQQRRAQRSSERETDQSTGLNQKGTTAVLVPRNAWLFQSNPVLYDLHAALHFLKEQVWSVTRYAKEIRRGDRVYLWEAGRRGGIAGVAEISEPVRIQSEPAEQLSFARAADTFRGDRLRTRLKILGVIEPVISRQSIISNPELRTLGVLRCPRGTNFQLSLDQWHALNCLVVTRNGGKF